MITLSSSVARLPFTSFLSERARGFAPLPFGRFALSDEFSPSITREHLVVKGKGCM